MARYKPFQTFVAPSVTSPRPFPRSGGPVTFPTRLTPNAWQAPMLVSNRPALGAAIAAADAAQHALDTPDRLAIAHSALREMDLATILETGGFND